MSTVAFSIDADTLKLLDELVSGSSPRPSRPAVVRVAIRELAVREHRRRVEAEEAAILCKHRKRLAHQVRALIAAQARP